MRKRALAIVFAAFMALSLTACGGAPADTAENTTQTEQPSDEAQEPADTEPESEYYFKDNVLVSEDERIEIKDWKVIPVGDTGNEYGEKPVIAFWYDTTNLSGNENVTPSTAWIAMFTAVQDNDPNMVNELNVGMLPDEQYLDSQMAQIKKDGTVSNAIAYELTDETTPVVLKATRGIGGDTLGEQTFDIASK